MLDISGDHSKRLSDSISACISKQGLLYAGVVFVCFVVINSSNAIFPFFSATFVLLSFFDFSLVFLEGISTLCKYRRV